MISRNAWIAVTMLLIAGMFAGAAPVRADATVSISIKNHHFAPAEVQAPANEPIMLRVKNLDATPMEFESVSLRVEKVVAGNSEGIIRLRPLAPGRYNFFDDFNPSATGVLVIK
jgi:Cupredoxin-like domain